MVISLPYKWVRRWGVKEGDKLPVYYDIDLNDKELAIFPSDEHKGDVEEEQVEQK